MIHSDKRGKLDEKGETNLLFFGRDQGKGEGTLSKFDHREEEFLLRFFHHRGGDERRTT